jgi:hypothetical protein
LIIIPIAHTEADLGSAAVAARRATEQRYGRDSWARKQRLLHEAWDRVEEWARATPIAPGRAFVFQDGLPVCGREAEIVDDLVAKGSRNGQILRLLMDRGAAITGTESPALLIKELERLNAAGDQPGTSAAAQQLLGQRDRYIATRIDETLMPGSTGILFVGLSHNVAACLPADVAVKYPLGRGAPVA